MKNDYGDSELEECRSGGSHEPLAALSWVLFQVCFTTALLVTALVTFVLIPAGRSTGVDMAFMYDPPALIMHNLNLVLMLTELLVNRFSFNLWHTAFTVLFGMVYVLFAWVNFLYGTRVFYCK